MNPIQNNSVPTPQAYTYAAPAGVPGDVTRADQSSVEPAQLIASGSPLVTAQSFGIAMVYATGGITQWGGSNVAADFAGVLVRQAPGISDNGEGLTGNIPNNVQLQGILVRGYINVLCGFGTPVRGQAPFVRTIATANNMNVGTFDATTDPGNNVQLTTAQAEWATDGKDGSNNAELRVWR